MKRGSVFFCEFLEEFDYGFADFLKICGFFVFHSPDLKAAAEIQNSALRKLRRDVQRDLSDRFPNFRIASGSDMSMNLKNFEFVFGGDFLGLIEFFVPNAKGRCFPAYVRLFGLPRT